MVWHSPNADAKLATIKIKRFAICVYKLFSHSFQHVNPFKNLAFCSQMPQQTHWAAATEPQH